MIRLSICAVSIHYFIYIYKWAHQDRLLAQRLNAPGPGDSSVWGLRVGDLCVGIGSEDFLYVRIENAAIACGDWKCGHCIACNIHRVHHTSRAPYIACTIHRVHYTSRAQCSACTTPRAPYCTTRTLQRKKRDAVNKVRNNIPFTNVLTVPRGCNY